MKAMLGSYDRGDSEAGRMIKLSRMIAVLNETGVPYKVEVATNSFDEKYVALILDKENVTDYIINMGKQIYTGVSLKWIE